MNFMTFHVQLGMSSSELTIRPSFFRGVGQPPTSGTIFLGRSTNKNHLVKTLVEGSASRGEAQVLRALTPEAETHGSLGGDTRARRLD